MAKDIKGVVRYFHGRTRSKNGILFHGEGITLADKWVSTFAWEDGHLSAILAGWMEDNWDELRLNNLEDDLQEVHDHLVQRSRDNYHLQQTESPK